MKNELLYISGMTCNNCQKTIYKNLIGLNGVNKAKVSYETGTAEISYNEDIINKEGEEMPRLSLMIKLEMRETKKPEDFSLDYLHFIIDGYEIPISFCAFGASHQVENGKGYMVVETGKGLLDDCYELEDCYDEIYEFAGLSREVLTARKLAEATKLTQMGICTDIGVERVDSLEITDMDTGETYVFQGDIKECNIDYN